MRKSSAPRTRAGPLATPGETGIPRLISIVCPASAGVGDGIVEIRLEQADQLVEGLGSFIARRFEDERIAKLGLQRNEVEHISGISGKAALGNPHGTTKPADRFHD